MKLEKILWVCSTDSNRWIIQKSPKLSPITRTTRNFVSIDRSKRLQTVDGFGGCFNEMGWDALEVLDAKSRAQVLSELFAKDGCDFNLARMPMGASDFGLNWYSFNDTPGDLAMKKFSIARDQKILIP